MKLDVLIAVPRADHRTWGDPTTATNAKNGSHLRALHYRQVRGDSAHHHQAVRVNEGQKPSDHSGSDETPRSERHLLIDSADLALEQGKNNEGDWQPEEEASLWDQ
jgi:hypothetical protein